jgi:hypothetical protein
MFLYEDKSVVQDTFNHAEDLSAEMMIPDLISKHPSTRSVLDKYGLKGCGGPMGPYESIRFFARAHEVDELHLLCELEAVLQVQSTGQSASPLSFPDSDVADTIYRRYFIAGILVVLTFGATWGAWLLWRIGIDHSFTGISMNEINAHGQAQIFGWMGLFIMGFAYQAFPRFWRTTLASPRLSVLSFWTMLLGIVAASIGLALGNHWQYALPVATCGSLLELAAVILFTWQIFATYKQSGKSMEPYIGFIFVALTWFTISTAYNVWHVWNTLSAVSDAQLAWYIAVFQPPLRDMQFHGLGITMILGVSLRTLPHIFDLPKISSRRAWTALVLISTAVIAEVIMFISYKLLHDEILGTLLVVPWLMLLVASIILINAWKLWRPFPEPDRSAKFIQAGYAWLVVSLIMLLLLPGYQFLSHIPFSHAYLGATNHAITVGFISMLIMGHAAKVVPTLNGVRPDKLPQLWGPWLLVNVGCLMRVVTQIHTDWSQTGFPIVGISGTLEVVGLTWWGLHLIAIMIEGKRAEANNIAELPQTNCSYPIIAENKVADVLSWYPNTQPVFVSYGFGAVTNPLMRKTVARQVTIMQACRLHDVPVTEFLQSLNQIITRQDLAPEQCGNSMQIDSHK